MATFRKINKTLLLLFVGLLANLLPLSSNAQTTLSEEVDSIALTDEQLDSIDNMPIELSEGRGSVELDSIATARYIIKQKPDDKFELYDSEKDTIIAKDLGWLRFSHTFIAPDSSTYCYFNFEKGVMSGLIGIDMKDYHKVTISNFNPNLVTSIGKCSTIDTTITKVCREALLQGMKANEGLYGQIAIVDVPTGHLKAWVAIRKNGNEYDDAELLYTRAAGTHLMLPVNVTLSMLNNGISPDDTVNTGNGTYRLASGQLLKDPSCSCGGYGRITFLDGMKKNSVVAMYKAIERFTDDAISGWETLDTICEDMNAMELAVVLSSVYYRDGAIYVPTLIGDSVDIQDKGDDPPAYHKYAREIMTGLNKDDGAQASYAPKGINIAGIYGTANELKTQVDGVVSQAAFGGCFPAESPRCGIGVFIDKFQQNSITSRQLSTIVNSVVETLSKM